MPTEPDEKDARVGIADAHGLVAIVGGLALLGGSCVCCVKPIRDDDFIYVIVGLGAAGLWSGLFGVTTPGSAAGRGLAWLGLVAILAAFGVLCFGGVFGRY